MRQTQERGAPWFHNDKTAPRSKHTPYFGYGLLQVVKKDGQMVQPALDTDHISRGIIELHAPAITDVKASVSRILGEQAFRKIHPFLGIEPQCLPCSQASSPAAKNLDDLKIAPPVGDAQAAQTPQELCCLLFGRLKSSVGSFPFRIATFPWLRPALPVRWIRPARA